MSQDRKVSVLRALLDRVQKRAGAPRPAVSAAVATGPASSFGSGAPAPSPAVSAAFPVAQPMAPAPSPSPPAVSAAIGLPPEARAPLPTTPFDLTTHAISSAPPSAGDDRVEPSPVDSVPPPAQDDEDEGPPSAPRLREVPEEPVPSEQDLDEQELEEEAQLKTPPPESGRQHVTPTVTASEPEEDLSITVTMEESEMPPVVESEPPPEVSAATNSARPDLDLPPQRLALVSEPEIELHGMTPLASIAEPVMPAKAAASTPASSPAAASRQHEEIELAVSVSSAAESVPPVSRPDFSTAVTTPPGGVTPSAAPVSHLAVTAPPAALHSAVTAPPSAPTVVSAPPVAPAAPVAPASPPVRLMSQPLHVSPAKPLPPVEVWASVTAPAALEGRVANFVGQNAKLDAKSFGEIVAASIALGDDES